MYFWKISIKTAEVFPIKICKAFQYEIHKLRGACNIMHILNEGKLFHITLCMVKSVFLFEMVLSLLLLMVEPIYFDSDDIMANIINSQWRASKPES